MTVAANTPDKELLVLGIIRDADNALTYDSIIKRSGLKQDELPDIISSLEQDKKIKTFPDDLLKPASSRRYITAMGEANKIEKLVAEHIWELSADGRLYFAYGSDLDPGQMYGVGMPTCHFLGKASLGGFRLIFDRYSQEWAGGEASIRFCDDSTVWGALYYITHDYWVTLDTREKAGIFNRRVRVPVKTCFGLFCAECYQSYPGEFSLPSRRYRDVIVSGGNFFGLPQQYLRSVQALPTASKQ